ncbi:MAG: iron-containing alcohol dehydrogenase [Thermodesulfobacteriota bacterium]
MQNFVLHNQTKILFGRDILSEIGRETAAWGKRALLVYGMGSISRSGVLDRIRTALLDSGIEVTEHGGVRSNPILSHVRAGIAAARTRNINVVVAAGGGSVIDSAKAIAAGTLADHDVWQFFRAKKSIRRALPVICVLTAAGAGSEMNGGMVLTNEETQQKFGIGNRLLCPRVSLLDPTLTFTVPPDQTAFGAIDAIAHSIEFSLTSRDPATPLQDRFTAALIATIMESCDRALQAPDDYQARADLMWCATLALNGWIAAGLGRVAMPAHLIEHSLSALYNLPHGAGLAIVLPAWLRHQCRNSPNKLACLGRRLFSLADGDRQAAAATIVRLADWFEQIGAPRTLTDAGIDMADIPFIADNALGQGRIWRLADYGKEIIMAILGDCR